MPDRRGFLGAVAGMAAGAVVGVPAPLTIMGVPIVWEPELPSYICRKLVVEDGLTGAVETYVVRWEPLRNAWFAYLRSPSEKPMLPLCQPLTAEIMDADHSEVLVGFEEMMAVTTPILDA